VDGSIDFEEGDWPSFLYSSDVGYDPTRPEIGLFRGIFLLRVSIVFYQYYTNSGTSSEVYRHIFTSPSSALKSENDVKASNRSNSKIHGLTQVTGRTIAYAAVQVCVDHTMICSTDVIFVQGILYLEQFPDLGT
jgi:hypothetical protein